MTTGPLNVQRVQRDQQFKKRRKVFFLLWFCRWTRWTFRTVRKISKSTDSSRLPCDCSGAFCFKIDNIFVIPSHLQPGLRCTKLCYIHTAGSIREAHTNAHSAEGRKISPYPQLNLDFQTTMDPTLNEGWGDGRGALRAVMPCIRQLCFALGFFRIRAKLLRVSP